MLPVLTLNNKRVVLDGFPRAVLRVLDEATSYAVAGAYFAPAFQRGYWDGREHLLTLSAKLGKYTAPIGLAEDIAAALDAAGVAYEVLDERFVEGERRNLVWNDSIKMRDYQLEACASLFNRKRLLFGCGLIKSPIRSGKTKTAAHIVKMIGLPSMILVPSQMLLWQTVKSFKECFPVEKIGVIGDSESDTDAFITVATMQSLARWKGGKSASGKKRPRDHRYDLVTNKAQVVVCDEAHHIRGESEWHKVVADFSARFRIALSATAYLGSNVEQGRGIIWLKGAIGPQRIDVGESRLINAGHLMKQNIKMKRVKEPAKFKTWKWSMELVRDGIWNNEARNQMIVDAAAEQVNQDRRTIIVTHKVEQTRHISELLYQSKVNHEQITGSTPKGTRSEIMDEFANGRLRCVVGTVLSEGVDIPNAEVVIVAGGGRDAKMTMQRMRNMTVCEGKKEALLIDFMDDFNPYLLKHSKERLKVYKSIPEFNVEVEG